jgi:hypothetical protein
MVSTEPNSITVTSPNGGEIFISGNTERIEWTNRGSYNFVAIDHSTDNGDNWVALESSTTENDGAYDWIVPAVDSEQCLVRVKDIYGGTVSDTSDGVFTIQCPVIYRGDINNDCHVNMNDLGEFGGGWLMGGCNSGNDWCGRTDIDHSGDVDPNDISIMAGDWLL